MREYPVPRRVTDVLEQLLTAGEVAAALELRGEGRAVAVLAARYEDFPAPVRESEGGRARLWYRPHVAAWARRHPGYRRGGTGQSSTSAGPGTGA